MATLRLLNPDATQVEAAIADAVRQAEARARSLTVEAAGLAHQIRATPEGVFQATDEGGEGRRLFSTPYRDFVGFRWTASLYAAWWTSGAGEKFVLIDGRRLAPLWGTPDSRRGVAPLDAKPEDAIRGWRRPRPRSIRIRPTFRGSFADLGRRPDPDPTREALRLAVLYGDASAAVVLHDYDEEHGTGKAR
jgi:hypothetical protein